MIRSKKIILILLFIFAVGCFLRLYQLGKNSLWLDELMQVQRASLPINECVRAVLNDADQMPLSYLTLHFTLQFGKSDFLVRLPEAIFGSLSILLIFQLGRMLFGTRAGLMAAFLLACSPFHINYSQESRFYASMIFFILLFNIAFFHAMRKEKLKAVSFLFLVVAGILSLYTHIFTLLNIALMLGVVLIGIIIKKSRTDGNNLSSWLIILALLSVCATYIPYYLFTGSLVEPMESSETIASGWREAWISWVMFTNGYPGKAIGEKAFYIVMLGSFLFGLWKTQIRSRWLGFYLLLITILIPVIIVTGEMKFGKFFAPRHISIAFPFVIILIARGVCGLSRWLQRSYRPTAATLFWILFLGYSTFTYARSYWGYERFRWKDDYRSAGLFIARNIGSDDYVIAPGFFPYIKHYLRGVSEDNLIPTFWNLYEEEEEMLHSGRRIWIFKSKYLKVPKVRKIVEECERLPGAKLKFYFPDNHYVIVIDPQKSEEELIGDFYEASFPSPSPMVSLANILIKNGEYKRARRLLEKKTVYNSRIDRAYRYYTIGKILMKQHERKHDRCKVNEASEYYRKAYETWPSFWNLENLVGAYYNTGNDTAFKKYALKAIKRFRGGPYPLWRIHRRLARYFLKSGNYNQAEYYARECIRGCQDPELVDEMDKILTYDRHREEI